MLIIRATAIVPEPRSSSYWRDPTVVVDLRHGYMQNLDVEGLADWAAAHGAEIRLLVRPGDHVLPGAAIVLTRAPVAAATRVNIHHRKIA